METAEVHRIDVDFQTCLFTLNKHLINLANLLCKIFITTEVFFSSASESF